MRSVGAKVLITGATGFLGHHVVTQFVEAGWHVRATGSGQSGLARLHETWGETPTVEIAGLNLVATQDLAPALEDALKGCNMVVHCAAYGVDYRQQDMEVALATNVMGSLRVLDAAARNSVERFVMVGTGFEYGAHDAPIAEDFELRPRGAYGVSKAAGTLAVLDAALNVDMQVAVVRPFGMYGPGEGAHKVVPQMISACRSGAPLDLSPGGQERDYVFVTDVVDALLCLAEIENFPNGEIINLASGRGISLRQLGGAVAEALGQSSPPYNWHATPYREDEIMSYVAEVEKAARLLQWRAATSLAQGIASTVEAIRNIDEKGV